MSARSEVHFRRSSETNACYLLTGCLTLREHADDMVVDVAWPGDLMGASAGIARAAADSTILEIPEAPLVCAMAENRELTAWVWKQQQRRTAALASRIRWLSHCNVEQRILRAVIKLHEQAESSGSSRTIPLSQREVAELAGVTREGTSTILNRLCKQGLVSLGRRRVLVEAPDQLRALLLPTGTSRAALPPSADAAA